MKALRLVGGVFVALLLGADTPIGPLYLAYGMADTGAKSFYIYLGPRFIF